MSAPPSLGGPGSRVDAFEHEWAHLRALTYDFIHAVPDARWETSPHPRFAPFNKQLRHLIGVQGVYHAGFRSGSADFSSKHAHYTGGLARDELLAGLRDKDDELREILLHLRTDDAASFAIDFFGASMDFVRYSYVMVQHEAIHHGQWSFYATFGEFETPGSWKLNWGL